MRTAHILYRANPPITNEALNDLFSASWPAHTLTDFEAQLQHSLTYVCAYDGERLIGFVNVAWDAGIHAFLLDTTVHPDLRKQGIGEQLVRKAADAAQSRGIHWLHVDYEPQLAHFYEQVCGFKVTQAGLMRLNGE